jgi:hypothetical protein
MVKRTSSRHTRKRKEFPPRYTSGLSPQDKKKQRRELRTSKKRYASKGSKATRFVPRPRLKSFRSKTSSWTQKFHERYPQAHTLTQIAKATGIPKTALARVKKKGMGAYYSSGSRPNQTAESWGLARMYSYILGGPTRKVDSHITREFHVKFPTRSKA